MIALNSSPRPVFESRQIVRHRRYGYRGVVVDRDDFCQADDQWYSKNQTQPDRDQPWYHVLVSGSAACTYAASENLVADSSGLPIERPLLSHYFSEFKDGIYIRNDQPWQQ
jgi:heat shock protein HspQ